MLCRQVTKAALDILMADELIAVNQDPLGIPGDLLWKQGSNEVCETLAVAVLCNLC